MKIMNLSEIWGITLEDLLKLGEGGGFEGLHVFQAQLFAKLLDLVLLFQTEVVVGRFYV